MQLIEARHIFIFLIVFDAIGSLISSLFNQKIDFENDLFEKMSVENKKEAYITDAHAVNGIKRSGNRQNWSKLFAYNKISALNTATVYINGSNYKFSNPASAYRLHPKLMLFPKHSFW